MIGSDSIVGKLSIVHAYELVTGASTAEARRTGRQIRVRCPDRTHQDGHASCDLDTSSDTWCCRSCDSSGGLLDLAVVAGHARDQAGAARWYTERVDSPQRNAARARVVASFAYEDADGNPVARVDRMEPGHDGCGKRFLQYRYANGEYIAGLSGMKLPLYHRGSVHECAQAGGTIYLCEGEGKGDVAQLALQNAGSSAVVTTVAGGANSVLQDEHIADLAGAKQIVVLADADVPGRKAARSRSNIIATAYPAADVRVIDLYPDRTDGSDIADWLREGHDIAELAALVDVATPTSSAIETTPTVKSEFDGRPELGRPSRGPSIATKIVQLLCESVNLLRDGECTYASFSLSEHQETHAVMSASFRRYAVQQYYKHYAAAPNGTALGEALATLDAKARFDGESCIVATRCAEHGGYLYLDLTNDTWTVVEISSDGWKIVPASDLPVRFVRNKDALPLPVPDPDGRLSDVDEFLPDDEHIRTFAKAFLVGALRPHAPQPVLPIIAPQGAGKSTIARLMKKTIDPTCSDLHGAPHEARDVTAAARHSYLLAFDNLSVIEPWLSDILCRLSTGGGFGGRQLYTNDGETIFDAIRPVIVTAIDDVVIRGDLADRALTIRLPARNDDVGYTEEDALWKKFELAHSSILGGLLTAASTALRRLPEIRANVRAGRIKLPRMADFALFVTAAEPALDIVENTFIPLLKEERSTASVAILESDLIFPPLLAVIEQARFNGYPADLLAAINAVMDDGAIRRDRRWPKTAAKLRNMIKRFESDLRRAGVEVIWHDRDSHTKRQTLSVALINVGGKPPQTPQTPQAIQNLADRGAQDAEDAEVSPLRSRLVTKALDI